MAWSYERLTDVERVVFDRLAVFADGFDLPAATAVCTAPPLDGGVEQIIVSLVDKSLVTVEHTRSVRYRQLEVVRQFAANRLEERGEAASMFDRAVAHFVDWLTVADQLVRGPDEWSWHPRIDREFANLRRTFARAVAVGDVDAATAIVCRAYVWATQHERMEFGEWADTLRVAPRCRRASGLSDRARRGRRLRPPSSRHVDVLHPRGGGPTSRARAGPGTRTMAGLRGFLAEVSYQTLDPSPAAAAIEKHSPHDGVWDVIGAWCDGVRLPQGACSLATAAAPPDPDDTAHVRRCLVLAEHHGNLAGDLVLLHAELGRAMLDEHVDSSNDPLSSNNSMRSRAVSLPRACCASMRFSPPPSLAAARRSSRLSRMCFMSPLLAGLTGF